MITWYTGDMFLDQAPIIINTVNCVGVMGKGIALGFKQRYPAMFEAYRVACQRGEVEIGKMWVCDTPDRRIINFPTKLHWKNPSEYPWIAAGLKDLRRELMGLDTLSPDVAMPALGCANGGLDWTAVKRMIWDDLHDLPHNIRVFIPTWNAWHK